MGIGEDVVDPKHLCHNGAETQRVADSCQPRNEVAQKSYKSLARGWNDCEEDHKIEDYGSKSDEVIEVGTRQPY